VLEASAVFAVARSNGITATTGLCSIHAFKIVITRGGGAGVATVDPCSSVLICLPENKCN
jgi:hypothetical protein